METNGHNNENGEQTKIYLRYTYLGNFVVARLQIRRRLVVDRCIVRVPGVILVMIVLDASAYRVQFLSIIVIILLSNQP